MCRLLLSAIFSIVLAAAGSAASPALAGELETGEFLVDTSIVPVPVPTASQRLGGAFDGTNCLVVWDAGATLVDGSGGVFDLSGNTRPWTSPAVAHGIDNYLVAFEFGAYRVGHNGTILDTLPIDVAGGSVAFDGTNYLAVWSEDSDLVGARVTQDGVVLDPGGIRISTAGNVQESPSIAFDGTNYLVVWQDRRTGAYYDIYAARVSPSGWVMDPNGIPVSTAAYSQSCPTVAFDGTNYLVAWQDYRSTDFDVYGARVSPAGNVLEPDGIAIATSGTYQRFPAVAFGGGCFLVTYELWNDDGYDGIWGRRVSPAGTVLDSGGIRVSQQGTGVSAVAFNGANFLVAWQNNGVWGTLVTAGGSVVNPDGSVLSARANRQKKPSSAWDGNNYLTVWQDERPGDTANIRCIRVSRSGTNVDPRPTTVSSAAKAQRWPSVAALPGQSFAVWEDRRSDAADVYGARIASNGSVLDSNGIHVSAANSGQQYPAITANGADYFSVWYDTRSGGGTLRGTRISRDGAVLDPDGILIADSGNWYPSVTYGGGNYLAVWSRSGDIFGARITSSGVVLDPGGVPVCTTGTGRNLPAAAFDGTNFLVVHTRGAGAVYGNRVSQSGIALDTGFLISSRRMRFGGEVPPPALTFDGARYVVVWPLQAGRNLLAATVSTDGVVQDTFPVTSGDDLAPALASGPTGEAFLACSGKTAAIAGIPCDAKTVRIWGKMYPFPGVAEERPAPRGQPPTLSASPNPFRTTTTIRFSIPSFTSNPSPVFIRDASGRLVRIASGHGRVTWDGRGQSGRMLPAGLYFVTVRTSIEAVTHKVLLQH